MDRHVRWFARQVTIGVFRRLVIETAAVTVLVVVSAFALGFPIVSAVFIAAIAIPVFAVVRLVLGCFTNPVTSSYLARWPHPSGTVNPTTQTNTGSPIDRALTTHGFTYEVTLDEWDGAKTNVYTRESNQIVAMTSSDRDLVILSGIEDDRLVVTTIQLVPPHEQLVVNQVSEVDPQEVLSNHVGLLKRLTASGHTLQVLTIDHVLELAAIEWDAWDQIGPLLGPFVTIGPRPIPTLLQVRIPPEEILQRTSADAPKFTAKRFQDPELLPAFQPAELSPPPVPTAPDVERDLLETSGESGLDEDIPEPVETPIEPIIEDTADEIVEPPPIPEEAIIEPDPIADIAEPPPIPEIEPDLSPFPQVALAELAPESTSRTDTDPDDEANLAEDLARILARDMALTPPPIPTDDVETDEVATDDQPASLFSARPFIDFDSSAGLERER